MNLKMICLALLTMLFVSVSAAETVIWQGSKQIQSWSDVLNIDGSKLSDVKTDDVLRLSITASAGAQLQVSWGSSWTNFDGLNALSINGDFEMIVTSQDINRLRQGIHIKGINFTLTAVTLKTYDGKYETLSEELFAWNDMLLSGAVQGETCTVRLKPYGGAGWYWQEPKDLSNYGSIAINLLQPASETMTVQLFYNEKNVKSQTIARGETQCNIKLSTAHKKVYSVNIISEKAQIAAIGSVNLSDKQGNIVPTAISGYPADTLKILSMEYYNTAGVLLSQPQHGINIIKINYKGGRTIVRKEIR